MSEQRDSNNADLLKPAEVCEVLRIGRGTLATMMKNKEIHPVLVGRRYRIPRSELDYFLQHHRGTMKRSGKEKANGET